MTERAGRGGGWGTGVHPQKVFDLHETRSVDGPQKMMYSP